MLLFLKEELHKASIPFTQGALERCEQFIQELDAWNKVYGFVKTQNQETLIQEQVMDSLSSYFFLKEKNYQTLGDLGTGVGFPGLVLSFFWKASFYLMERSERKLQFLRYITQQLQLENVHILGLDIKQLDFSYHSYFDAFLLKAFSPFNWDTLRAVKPFLKDKGIYIFYRAQEEKIKKDFQSHNYEIKKVYSALGQERRLVLLKKEDLS